MIEEMFAAEQAAEWLRTGGTLGLLALAAKLFVDNRRLKIAESQDRRDGYGSLIMALSADVEKMRAQYRQCEQEHAQTRSELDGLRRQVVNYQLIIARAVPPSRRTPEIEAMLRQLEGQSR